MAWADYQHMFCVLSSSLKFVSVSMKISPEVDFSALSIASPLRIRVFFNSKGSFPVNDPSILWPFGGYLRIVLTASMWRWLGFFGKMACYWSGKSNVWPGLYHRKHQRSSHSLILYCKENSEGHRLYFCRKQLIEVHPVLLPVTFYYPLALNLAMTPFTSFLTV